MSVYVFGEFELDTLHYEIRHLGNRIEMGGKPFDALLYFVRNADRLISKDELVTQVWGVSAMSASTVPTCIGAIRQVLARDPSSAEWLQTVRGRGYRFLAPIRETPDLELRAGATSPPFVGREIELDYLRRHLALCMNKRSALVILSGEPGIGKTRLLEQFASIARTSGALPLLASCPEDEGTPALWPWHQVLRTLRNRGLLRASQRDLEILEPVLDSANSSPDAGRGQQAPPLPASQARFRLFDVLTQLLGGICEDTPVVLVFDDLHRADPDSLLLLEFVVQELSERSLLVVVGLREDENDNRPGSGVLVARLVRHPNAAAIRLVQLGVDDVQDLLRLMALGSSRESALAHTLHERSGGNPFFLTQLLYLLQTQSPGNADANEALAASAMPQSVREAILRQIASLEPLTRHILAAASVQGREFALHEVAAALNLSVGEALLRLSSAVSARIISPAPPRLGAFRFNHELVRDVLYEGIDLATRSRLHLDLAQAIATSCGNYTARRAAELTHHFLQVRHADSCSQVLRFAREAAQWATAHLAYDDAVTYYRHAVAALERNAAAPTLDRAEAMLELGRAELRATRREHGRDALRRSAQLAREAKSPALLARAALSMAPGAFALEVGVYDDALVTLLEESLRLLPASEGEMRAKTLARLSIALVWADDENRRGDLSNEALRSARLLADPETLAFALLARHGILGGPAGRQERLSIGSELRQLAQRMQDPTWRFLSRILLITDLLEEGRFVTLWEEIFKYSQDAADSRQPQFIWYSRLFRAMQALLSGRFEQAAILSAEFYEIGSRANDANATHSFGAQRALRLWESGDADEAAQLCEGFVERYPIVPGWRSSLAHFYCEAGRLNEAQRVFDSVVEEGISKIPRNEIWGAAIATLCHACAALEDRLRAQELFDLLGPDCSGNAVLGFGVASLGPYAQSKALVAMVLGDWDDATRLFDLAAEESRRGGSGPWLANALCEHARMLKRRGRPRDARVMREKAQEAIELARRLGMRRIHQRASALL